MWQIEPRWYNDPDQLNFTFDDGIGELGAFLETVAYDIGEKEFKADHPDETISLMEVLELWLWRGNGLDFCPTHESFLATTIRIIDHWLQSGSINIAHRPLWRWKHDGVGVAIPLMPPVDERSIRSSHRLLDREVFAQLRARALANRHEQLAADMVAISTQVSKSASS